MHSLLWLSHCSYLLNASASWLQPVLSLFHWEPNVGARVTLILEVKWYFEMILSIWEKVCKTFVEGVNLSAESIVLDWVMMVVFIISIVNMPIQIVCSSCLVMLNKRCVKVILSDSSGVSVDSISGVRS